MKQYKSYAILHNSPETVNKVRNSELLQTRILEDVIMNIEKSLSTIITIYKKTYICTYTVVRFPFTINVLQIAKTNINTVLFELDSNRYSGFFVRLW